MEKNDTTISWLVVLDPIQDLKSETDTSLAVITQARNMGITVDTATIEDLFFESHAAVLATDANNNEKTRALGSYELIFMRKEPPYDLAFHYATHLLSLADSLVVNSPNALRDFNEKLIALPFVQYMPPTLVSSDIGLIGEFINRQGTVVVKSLDSFQGKSVERFSTPDSEYLAMVTANGSRPVMAQKFLESVYEGDKRVILLGERLLGATTRRPIKGYHANFAKSEALKTTLTKREESIVAEIGPWLLKHGIHFSGLDFIGEQLTEINITCPTGIMQISALEQRNLAEEVVQYFNRLLEQTTA